VVPHNLPFTHTYTKHHSSKRRKGPERVGLGPPTMAAVSRDSLPVRCLRLLYVFLLDLA
jgi:hypothetical protein